LNGLPALAPLAVEEPTRWHYEGLTEKSRAQSPDFRLLARDPEVLTARTRRDEGYLPQPRRGLPRAERELTATAVSRVNGCILCTSVYPALPPVIPAGARTSTGCCRTAHRPTSNLAETPSRQRSSA